MLSDRYLATTSPQRIAAHLRLVERLEEDVIATDLFHHPDLDSSELVIATRDVPGLFSLIAGTLAAHGINILSAQINTRADGIAITVVVLPPPPDWPKIVTRSGSPPKVSMLSRTHSSAATKSCTPTLVAPAHFSPPRPARCRKPKRLSR